MKKNQGNVTMEYVLCLAAFLVFVIGVDGFFGMGSVFQSFKSAFDLFFGGASSILTNMDLIPNAI